MIGVLVTEAGYGFENVGDDAILAVIFEQLDFIGNLDVAVIARKSKCGGESLGVKTLKLAGLVNRLQIYA